MGGQMRYLKNFNKIEIYNGIQRKVLFILVLNVLGRMMYS